MLLFLTPLMLELDSKDVSTPLETNKNVVLVGLLEHLKLFQIDSVLHHLVALMLFFHLKI